MILSKNNVMILEISTAFEISKYESELSRILIMKFLEKSEIKLIKECIRNLVNLQETR